MKLRAPTVTDGYKLSHGAMYADGTNKVYSNLTPRSDKIFRRSCTPFYDGKLVWVGAQGAVQEIVEMWDSFFKADKDAVVGRFASRMAGYLGGYEPAVKAIAELHDVGYLPLTFKSLPEGSKVNFGIPVMTVTNTLPQFYWLTNYLETVISNLTWKTATNATIAAEYKAICKHYAELTGTDDFTVSIQCHDFSMRGMSGPEDAARAGFAHLTQFIGTDTLPAMDYAQDYYDATDEELIAISVPATEHAVATSNILGLEKYLEEGGYYGFQKAGVVPVVVDSFDQRTRAEFIFMKDLITRKFPTGIVSYVADSFDFWAVLTYILPALKDVILAREASNVAPGKLVIRPDSGDPVEVVCGKKIHKLRYEVTSAEEWEDAAQDIGYNLVQDCRDGEEVQFFVQDLDGNILRVFGEAYVEYDGSMHFEYRSVEEANRAAEEKGAIEVLWEIFGGTETEKGYKLLDSHIGLIYGDSITTRRGEEILRRLAEKGFASGNVVFGVGSYTYQCNTRDTFGFAVKATYTEVDGEGVAIFKDPKTDAKKKSAKGLLMVGKQGDDYILMDDVDSLREACGWLIPIWEDGQWLKRTTLAEIRDRLK